MPALKIPDTDPAAQKALAEFLAAEVAKKPAALSREKFNKNAPQRETVMTTNQLINLALDRGLRVVEGGGGKHMKVFDAQGRLLTEIPRHPGDIATGTCRSILKAIKKRA